MGSQKMLMPLVQNRRGFDLREYNKSLIPRNLYTAIRNLAVVAWITLPWVSYLLAYAVLLFGSDHYRPIGNKQMPSSAWQSTNHGAAELWELQEIYVMVTKSRVSAGEINTLVLEQPMELLNVRHTVMRNSVYVPLTACRDTFLCDWKYSSNDKMEYQRFSECFVPQRFGLATSCCVWSPV